MAPAAKSSMVHPEMLELTQETRRERAGKKGNSDDEDEDLARPREFVAGEREMSDITAHRRALTELKKCRGGTTLKDDDKEEEPMKGNGRPKAKAK